MLGINQYRQRLPGEPVLNTGAGQPALNTLALNRGAMSIPESGSVVSTGDPGGTREVLNSLAGLRDTLQAEPVPGQSKPIPTAQSEVEKRPVDAAKIRQSKPLDVLSETPASIVPQAAQISQTTPPAAPEQNSEQIQESIVELENISFTLACWHVSDDVLVINGFAQGERANRTHLELLANMLRAIGQLPSNLPAAELIEWPLSPGAESTLEGAKTQLSMFLLGRQQVRPFRYLLAMGDEPVRLLAKNHAASTSESGSADTIFIPSLQTMLAEPSCKREVWQTLRHLRGDR
jgi:hypothetical protein